MYENKTYDTLMQEKLSLIDDKYDKRPASIIYDALGPNSAETAQIYICLDWMLQQMFGDTADREYLIKIANDTRGMKPYSATYAVLKGVFNVEVPIGSRFNLETLNYKVLELINENDHSYKLVCEILGEEGNQLLGTLIPINNINGLMSAELTEILIPGEDEEDTETFRQRWRNAFNAVAFGGNKADYKEKINAISGVGGCKVYRATNEYNQIAGIHVKCVVINSNFGIPSTTLINSIQQIIDPYQDMEGDGLAPIGHIAHIISALGTVVNVAASITYDDGYSYESLQTQIADTIDKYLLELNKSWEATETSNLIVRISRIESDLLGIEGIIDITGTALNSMTSNLALGVDAIAIRGTVNG